MYSNSDNFNGEYLEKTVDDKTVFYQIEFNDNFIKILQGKSKGSIILSEEKTFQQYSSLEDCKTHSKKFVAEKISSGYIRNKDNFKKTFTNEELDSFKKSVSEQIKNNLLQLPGVLIIY